MLHTWSPPAWLDDCTEVLGETPAHWSIWASISCSQSSLKLSWCTSQMLSNTQQAAITLGTLSMCMLICLVNLRQRTQRQSPPQPWHVRSCSYTTFAESSTKVKTRKALSTKITAGTQNLQVKRYVHVHWHCCLSVVHLCWSSCTGKKLPTLRHHVRCQAIWCIGFEIGRYDPQLPAPTSSTNLYGCNSLHDSLQVGLLEHESHQSNRHIGEPRTYL